MYGVLRWRAPDQEVDQRGHGETFCKKIVKHVTWTAHAPYSSNWASCTVEPLLAFLGQFSVKFPQHLRRWWKTLRQISVFRKCMRTVRRRVLTFSSFLNNCLWPPCVYSRCGHYILVMFLFLADCKPEGPLFPAECLSVCVCVCLWPALLSFSVDRFWWNLVTRTLLWSSLAATIMVQIGRRGTARRLFWKFQKNSQKS